MSKLFMNIKKVTIPVLTAILIASQLTACGASTTKQANSMIASSVVNNEQDITLEIAVPKSVEQGTRTNLVWKEVGSLTTQPELRKEFDKLFEVSGDTGSKTGWVYDSQNITLRDAIESISYKLFTTPEALKSLADTVNKNYVDLDNSTDMSKAVMAINGYFNILPDNEVGYANPNQTMTRKEVMAALFRASNKVTTNRKLDEDFNKLVGDTEYNIYAQEYKGDTYLNTSENKNTYNSVMSRGEAIYLLMNRFYGEELDTYKADNVKLEDAKDKGEETGRTRIEELSEMLNNPEAGVEHSMYKAIALAYEKGILDTAKTRWNEGITKEELLELIIKVEAEFNKAGVIKGGLVDSDNRQGEEEMEAEGSMTGGSIDTKDSLILADGSLNENYKDKKAVEAAKKAIDEERKLTEKLEKEEKARKEAENKKKEQSVVNATSKKDNKSLPSKNDKSEESKKDESKVKKDETKVSKEAPAKDAPKVNKDTVKDNKAPKKNKVNNKSKVKKDDKKKKKDGKVDMSGWSDKEKKAGRKMTEEEKKEDEKLKKQGAKGGLRLDDSWTHPSDNEDDWAEWEEVDE